MIQGANQSRVSRREFMSNLAKTVSITSLGSVLATCSSQESDHFSFFDRVGDPICHQLSKTKGPVLIAQTTEHLPLKSILPSEVSSTVRKRLEGAYPGMEIVDAKVRTMGFPEPNREFAQEYAKYAREIIAWAREHPALQGLPKPDLEVIVTGQTKRRTSAIPAYVNLCRVDNYNLTIKIPQEGQNVREVELFANDLGVGGRVEGLINYTISKEGIWSFRYKDPSVFLATGSNGIAGLLMAPLSEYIPLVIKAGARNQFAHLEKVHGGRISSAVSGEVRRKIKENLEAASEAATGHLLLEYLTLPHVRERVPPETEQLVRNNVMVGMPKRDSKYTFVPTAFDWMDAESINPVLRTYMFNSPVFSERLRMSEKSGKGKK